MFRVSSHTIADYRDERLKHVSPASARKELYLLSSIFKTAEREWGFEGLANPVERVTIPSGKTNRGGRLDVDTMKLLLGALENCPHTLLPSIVIVALETGMRRSEILSLKWHDIDFDRRLAYLPQTKNGEARYLPLTERAFTTIKNLARDEEKVFPISANAVRLAWERFKKSAGIGHVRFHDLRHEAISTMFEKGLTVPEVASISGHKTPSMLFRYAHADLGKVARKLQSHLLTD
jgi:integrase